MNLVNIEAVLFDSGKVLNAPRTGHWFISPRFFDVVNKETFYGISKERRKMAFTKASKYIHAITMIKTKEEECEHFRNYYQIFSEELPELQLHTESVNELAMDIVYNPEKYQFFEDALHVIPILNQKYKLAVVSDAWPSLREVFISAGFYTYFSSFIISSEIGVTKPDQKMYISALMEMNIPPEKAVFIDDNINNCLGAMKLGIKAVLLCRDTRYFCLQKVLSLGKGYQVIHSLKELL